MPAEPKYHTAEHILTAVISELFNGTIIETHFKGKKVRCDYKFKPEMPLENAIRNIEQRANKIISMNLTVTCGFAPREEAATLAGLKKVPEEKDIIRLVKIGDYNITACNGEHIKNTREIGKLEIRTFNEITPGTVRLTFMLS